MSDLRELRSLRSYHMDRPALDDQLAQYFRSDDYPSRLDALRQDPQTLARLTIHLLGHMALDPKSGSRTEHFLGEPGEDGVYFVCLRFHRTVNIVGGFSLPADAPEVAQLKQAIAANLASRMFKAAKMHRRLEDRNIKRFRRITQRANASMKALLAQETPKAPHPSRYTEHHAFMKELHERADTVYDGVYQPLHDRLTGRVHAVGQAAFDEDFRGSFPEILMAFAKRYVVPTTAM